jgi:hypothetical protein
MKYLVPNQLTVLTPRTFVCHFPFRTLGRKAEKEVIASIRSVAEEALKSDNKHHTTVVKIPQRELRAFSNCQKAIELSRHLRRHKAKVEHLKTSDHKSDVLVKALLVTSEGWRV